MLANRCATAVLALRSHPLMLANRADAAVLALRSLPLMLTNVARPDRKPNPMAEGVLEIIELFGISVLLGPEYRI